MSWELASFVIVGAVIVGGFAWYERSRPPAQVVALVAALAALAVAGRVAFAAIPNVVATTDVVVFSGLALGPAPGFAVGALAGLVSNFWLGQGPWTPWQMAGWGMCGVFGAALGLAGRRPGRLQLAVACALAGVAYGALLNFSLMATYGGDLSVRRFLALEARAIPFDAAHAIGNATLALLAGPAMVAMLQRFRARFQWRPAAVAASALLALAALTTVPAAADAAGPQSAASWLASQQNRDGGWGATPERDSSLETTAWVVLGLESVGRNPADIARFNSSALDYMRAHAGDLESAGELARTIVAIEGAGANPRDFGGRNLVAALLKRRRSNGSYEGWPGSTAYAAIALRAAGAGGSLGATLSWLSRAQDRDGGWGDQPNDVSNADVTGAVLQAMPDSQPARHGLAYLRDVQRPNGGFAIGGNGAVNSQSTAWAVQGIVAVGADPAGVAKGGIDPLEYLAGQQADDGHYRYSSSSDQTPVFVTGQVLAAVSRQAFPIPEVAREPEPQAPPSTSAPSSGIPESTLTPPLPTAPGGGIEESGGSALPPSVGGGSGGTGGGGSLPPAATPGLPETGLVPETEAPSETAPAAPPFEAAGDAGPTPWAPVGVGLAGTGVAFAAALLLGRRFDW